MSLIQEIGLPPRKSSASVAPMFSAYEFGPIAPSIFTSGGVQYAKCNVFSLKSLFSNSIAVAAIQASTYLNTALGINNYTTSGSWTTPFLPPPVVGSTSTVLALKAGALTFSSSGVSFNSFQLTNQSATCFPITTYDGTNFWAFGVAAGNGLVVSKSTDGGLTWAPQTLSGLPSSAVLDFSGWFSGSTTAPYGSSLVNLFIGEYYGGAQAVFAFWAGARFIVIAPGVTGSNYIAFRSSNGTSWGGDETTAIINNATIGNGAGANSWWWYRNGNTAFIYLGGQFSRKTTDGGVTWSDTTVVTSSSGTLNFRTNPADATKLLAYANGGGTTAYVSANSGSTWSSITFTFSPGSTGSIVYKNSTILTLDSSNRLYCSTNDGTSFTQAFISFGGTGVITSLYADANRFYAYCSNSGQLATSTNGTTWTLRTITNVVQFTPTMIAAVDSNTLLMKGSQTPVYYSTDGGVTWTQALSSQDYSSFTNYYCRPITVGQSAFLMSGEVVLASELTNPTYLKPGPAVTATRSGANVFLKVN